MQQPGTALTTEEIDRVEIFVRQAVSGPPEYTINMLGGCQRSQLDLASLVEGQKYLDGVAYDVEGRVSVLSTPAVPFVYAKAPPNPPADITIQ